MKLIDLLVQELPRRGGWPEGVYVIEQNYHGKLFNGSKTSESFLFDSEKFEMVDAWREARVTRKQYEAALAAAHQSVWNGEGLPPVCAEVEVRYRHATNAEWVFFRCVAVDCETAFGWTGKEPVGLSVSDYEFRPIRSEADNKRAIGVTALAKAGGAVDFEYGRKTIDGELSAPGWYELYDKIAAGEVAGIRIE
ncbi:hypothetical protein DOX48_08500 [Cronobacter malonaticus]|uniref:hypothetical protein n=1 Tax=Cronobacter malonaticus TaxID=413503 RepID=UPI001375BA2B|nr:hypothetical protein [Cronobacter malonaticus]EGT4313505.1 hypothetical protein [Cronobacter malonaticus]NCH48163.1 hypothetical protein [Cronobacter malonaticus]